MTSASTTTRDVPVIAFGPAVTGFGSWPWVGLGLAEEVAPCYRTTIYQPWEWLRAEVVIVVKHLPPPDWVESVSRRASVVYCPVDFYGSAEEIDRDAPLLRRCARVVVHAERLRRYFEPYAPVLYLDHHVQFAAPLRQTYRDDGPLLWVGVRSNLPPLVAWVNEHPLSAELWVLTNPEVPGAVPTAGDLGFLPGRPVRVGEWTPKRQVEWTAQARAALDVKGDDFRARHKPPAKAIDFLASGVPLALSPGHCATEHLARLGFEAASLQDAARWLSQDYWEETRRFGGALRELLSRERVGRRFRYVLDEVLAERTRTGQPRRGPGFPR